MAKAVGNCRCALFAAICAAASLPFSTTASPALPATPAIWPDGSRMDGWFADKSPVDEAKLGRHRRAEDFGAKPEDTGMQTERLQSAIDQIAAGGGGVLVLGPGTWNSSSLFFRPGVHLKLEKGATLKGPSDGGDADDTPTSSDGGDDDGTPCFFLEKNIISPFVAV